MANKYADYFNINEKFWKCIDSEAVWKSPELWKNTFPHPTFIELLKNMERMLSGGKQPVWIHGAYGTGKSQCAWALKKILEVPENELREYWNRDGFEALRTNANMDLLTRLLGHKSRNIVTAYRYASGGINGTRDLLLAVQESVKQAIVDAGVMYTGDDTMKDSVIAWLQDPLNKKHFDEYLELPEFASRFSQSTANEVIADLQHGGEVKELMDNIFYLSDKRGITAFELNTDRLIDWIKDIIVKNDIKIVLIWDEFSSFFKNNRNSLDEFQKIASLAQSTAFYFCVVTHQTSSVITNSQDQAWKVVQQRFEFTEITLPDSIAFDLTHSALEINPNARQEWLQTADYLYAEVTESSKAVVEQIKKTEANSNITAEVFKSIMPLHPFAAMVLKYIATAFEANQRSMFDFIKTADNDDVKAFQWFIGATASDDDRPLLTVDMLWNFFYEKGRNNLTADIQAILDTYPRQKNLGWKQQAVLKTILIIQAIDQRTGNNIDLFRLIDRNLSLAFEGVSELSGNAAVSVAKQLVADGILFKRKIGNNLEVYNVAALAGDQSKIEKHKADLRSSITTAKLVSEGGLQNIIPLSSVPGLKLRFDIDFPNGKLLVVSYSDFSKTLSSLRNQETRWHFIALVAFAKDDSEVTQFRKAIQEAVANEDYKHIVFIDVLSTPLGADAFEQYLDYQSMSMYYTSNDNDLARKYAKDAKNILDNDWRNRIQNNAFVVYTNVNRDGDRYPNTQGVLSALESIVHTKYPLIMDFNRGLTETMLKTTFVKGSAKHGVAQTSGNAIVNIEKSTLAIQPNSVWKVADYWTQPALSTLPISKIKIALDAKITTAFESGNGQISIREICDMLEQDYGFAPSNLTAFLIGFLLKEYCTDTYRFIDSTGKPLDSASKEDTLAIMLSEYIGNSNLTRYKDSYIARMTADEKAFYELSERAFGILPNSCATVSVASISVGKKMQELGLPIWALQQVDENGIYDVIEKYITLVQKEGAEAQTIAIEIGKIAGAKSRLGDDLQLFITKENCQKGIREYLKTFENGQILDLANEIHAEQNLMDDVRRLFSVERSRLWIKQTGEDEIRKLLVEYGIAKETSGLLLTNLSSLKAALAAWRDKLKFIHISSETAKSKQNNIVKLIDFLSKIYAQSEILPDGYKSFYEELKTNGSHLSAFINNENLLFSEIYEPYLDELNADDVNQIIGKLPHGMFAMSSSECNIKVKAVAEDYRKGLLKVRLFELWKSKTGTKNPKEWSATFKCPILALFLGNNYDQTKKVFDILNQSNPPEFAVKEAIAFIETATFFDDLASEEKRNTAFIAHVIGDYSKILTAQVVKAKLDNTTTEPYEWISHPAVKQIIKKLAEAEYNAGGSDRALAILSGMTTEQREKYIERLIKDNVAVGLEIITRGGNVGE
jgi:hypothetical protein